MRTERAERARTAHLDEMPPRHAGPALLHGSSTLHWTHADTRASALFPRCLKASLTAHARTQTGCRGAADVHTATPSGCARITRPPIARPARARPAPPTDLFYYVARYDYEYARF